MTSSPRISVNLEMNPKPILVELNNSDPSQKYRPEISDKEELEMVDKKQIKAVDTQLKNSKINGYFGGLKILTLLCEGI